ncbi:esterase/lipase family protein [Gordonia jinhuaensis]|nr:alpha/beta fold hydrolase [Gordonia jinhuaensis]
MLSVGLGDFYGLSVISFSPSSVRRVVGVRGAVLTLIVSVACAVMSAPSADAAPAPRLLSADLASYGLPSYALDGVPAVSDHVDRRHPAAHRYPVILVHGTWSSAGRLVVLADRLAAAGYATFAFNYGRDESSVSGRVPGVYATGPIAESARQLAAFVRLVRDRTGAEQVDLVGHSQGGLVIRRYLADTGGAAVHHVVTLAGNNHGTTLSGISRLAGEQGVVAAQTAGLRNDARAVLGAAALDQLVGSTFLAETNAHADTVPGVGYTVIATRFDEVVTPYTSTFLRAGPGATVDNIDLQSRFPADISEHTALPRDPNVDRLVIEALAHG